MRFRILAAGYYHEPISAIGVTTVGSVTQATLWLLQVPGKWCDCCTFAGELSRLRIVLWPHQFVAGQCAEL